MSKRAASGPPPRASAEEDDDGLPPVGRDRMLNLWRPQNPSPVQIIASLVMPQTANAALTESTHPFDIDQARFEARVARVVAYCLRHPPPLPANAPVDPSESMAGLDYHPLLDTRPPFLDMYEAAIALGDHAARAEMDAILSAEPEDSNLRAAWRAHAPRFIYAAGVAGDLLAMSHFGRDIRAWRVAGLVGLIEGGHFELFLQTLQDVGVKLAMRSVCDWLIVRKKTHLLTQGDRLARIYAQDQHTNALSVLNALLFEATPAYGKLLIAFASLDKLRRRVVRLRTHEDARMCRAIIIEVLVALIDPKNPQSVDYYNDLLTVFGFDVECDFNHAHTWLLRSTPLTPTLIAVLSPHYLQTNSDFRARLLLEYGPASLAPGPEPDWVGEPFHVYVDVGRAVTILTTLSVRPVFHGLAPGDWPRLLDCIPSEERWTFLEYQIYRLGSTDPSSLALIDILAREYGPSSVMGLGLENSVFHLKDASIDYLKTLSAHVGVNKIMGSYVYSLLDSAMSIKFVHKPSGWVRAPVPMGNFLRTLQVLCPVVTEKDSVLGHALVELRGRVMTPEMDHFVDTVITQ